VTLPSGAVIRNRYDSDNPDLTARGNLEREERTPDAAARGGPGHDVELPVGHQLGDRDLAAR
jgi:hypothetical protein